MKVAILNGGIRSKSTMQCLQFFLKTFTGYGEIEVQEIKLPRDMPYDCCGCNSCIMNGEASCPHSEKVKPIVEALKKADLIIIASPVYNHDITDHLKVLLDHLNYIWLNHRPLPGMFRKIALTIATSDGACLSHTLKTMKNNLFYWGVKRVFSFRSKDWRAPEEELSERKKKKLQRKVIKKAGRINKALEKGDKLSYPIARRLFFIMMKGMMKKNTWNEYDRSYWESQGWLDKNKPFIRN